MTSSCGAFCPRGCVSHGRWEFRLLRLHPVINDVESPTQRTAGLACAGGASCGLAGLVFAGVCLSWNFYATTVGLLQMIAPAVPLPMAPVVALEPSRIAESYGLFAVMTRARYEIEFQGSNDGQNWTAYPFRYKPQDPRQPPWHLRAVPAAI